MGFAGIAAGVGAATALAGTAISYTSAQHSAAAAASAQSQELSAQNAAFQERLAAQNEQTYEQSQIEDQSQAAYLKAEEQMRSAQSEALSGKSAEMAKMNTQEQQIADQTKQAVQQTTQQEVTPASLQQAQAASEQARMSAVQPTVQDIAASNPLPSSGEGSATKSALAKSMSDAADYTQKYGQNLATLSSYSAPLQAVDVARTNLGTNLMPAAVADQLLKAGVSARLSPYDTAYSGAGTIGQAAIDANTQDTSEKMSLASTKEQYASNLADLGQTDTDSLIQTGLNVTQARDAATSSLGSGLEKIGTSAIELGASQGAFSNLFGTGTGTGALSGAAGYVSGATGSSLGGLGAPAIGTETITPYWTGLMKGSAAFN